MGSGLEGDQLLPGLPDELVLQNVVPRLPYHARARAQILSQSWRNMLLRQEALLEEQQRWRLALMPHRGLLLRHGPSCNLKFLDFADMHTHPLPPLPFTHRTARGIVPLDYCSKAFIFCVKRRIFAAQCYPPYSVRRLYMLDVAAGLFRWQQRFGLPHEGDVRGSIQVSSPYKCTIVRFRVYVVAQCLPASLEPKNAVAAAMYDAWEDMWEEIPSPLGNSSTARLLFLGPSPTGVVARVYDNQCHRYDARIFVHTHKLWQGISKVKWPVSAFSTGSFLHCNVLAQNDEAVCTCCGAPTIICSLKPVYSGRCNYQYKACRCYSKPQPDVANAVVAILRKLEWRAPPVVTK